MKGIQKIGLTLFLFAFIGMFSYFIYKGNMAHKLIAGVAGMIAHGD